MALIIGFPVILAMLGAISIPALIMIMVFMIILGTGALMLMALLILFMVTMPFWLTAIAGFSLIGLTIFGLIAAALYIFGWFADPNENTPWDYMVHWFE